jgi:hypothetical protein
MKTKNLAVPAIFMFLLGTCTMEPLFYYTHLEYPPIKPIINGAPSKIVTAGNYLYAANRNGLWKYEYPYGGARSWESMGMPSGESHIKTLAAAGTNLYLLGETGAIHEWNGTSWSSVPLKIGKIQQIHGAGTRLFAGDGKNVYEISSMSSFTLFPGPEGLLSGAVYDGSSAYYISVSDGDNPGVFQIASSSKLTSERIMGIVWFDGKLTAVDTSGNIHTDIAGSPDTISTGVHFTGALAVKRASVRIIVRNTGTSSQALTTGTYGYNAGGGTFAFTINTAITVPAGGRQVFIAQAQGDGKYQVSGASNQSAFTGGPALAASVVYDVEENTATCAGILLLGIAAGGSGTFRCGYRELDLNDILLHSPGDSGISTAYPSGRPTSIDPSTKNTAAIGNYPVNALMILPDSDSGDAAGRPVILASTQQNGLWSYRFRRTEPQWNGENNN